MNQGLDQAFQALSDTTRRAVVMRLAVGPASVGELAQPHQMALPSFLKHIGILEHAGLIQTEKTGRVRTCRLDMGRFGEVLGWLDAQRAVWESRTDRLQALAEAEAER